MPPFSPQRPRTLYHLRQPFLSDDANFTVQVNQNGKDYFVWKKEKLEATPERIAELEAFSAALTEALLPQL